MLNQFNEEYKGIMLSAENRVRQFGHKEILPEDVIIQIAAIKSGNIYDLFTSFGLNESIVVDVLSRPPFSPEVSRDGNYVGISERVKNLIVMSMKIAASFQKSQAGIEDFLLALFRTETENWFYQLLDFVGVSPKDFETQVVEINTLIAGVNVTWVPENGGIFGPIEEIMKMLEGAFSAKKPDEGGDTLSPKGGQTPFSQNKQQQGKESKTPALDFFGIDLTLEAKEGKIDPIIGRRGEIDRLISILNRKTKNNPCLVGDPGVGKTAVVEWLALRIARGEVPFAMRDKRIISVDMSLMVAGTKYRWEFEWRLKQVIDEASKLENETILFIDEIHTIIGAWWAEGTLDAANILKPAMARGKICLIWATTLSEYQKYIEKDAALERRFQKIDVPEPDHDTAIAVISWLRGTFEEFHNLIIDDDAIEDAVALSTRYVTDRFLPDKAIDLIDEACSVKSMTYTIDTSEVEAIKERIAILQKEIEALLISQQYQKALAKRREIEKLQKDADEKRKKRVIPRKNRLHITSSDVQRVIHQMTWVPLKNLEKEDLSKLRWLAPALKKQIIWQDEAIDAIVSSLKRSRVGISSTKRPIWSFLFLGPTGVGKTELVKTLAKEFFSDEKALIKIDMSEYQDKSSASKLIGTTAGYVGYEEGWLLTEKVRRKPYSIVLFDEIEKGDFDVYNLLLQILEDGTLSDGKWRMVNFKNTIVIMTSNLGSEEFNTQAQKIWFTTTDSEEEKIISDYEWVKAKVLKSLSESFAPEFLNRIDKTVVFNPLDKKVLKSIVILQLDEFVDRLSKLGIAFAYDARVVSHIVAETYNPEYGARPVRRYIQDKIEDSIADAMVEKKAKESVNITIEKKNLKFTWK
jgi:ATP-dependent Clp protease ATP-binding subunit ClpC